MENREIGVSEYHFHIPKSHQKTTGWPRRRYSTGCSFLPFEVVISVASCRCSMAWYSNLPTIMLPVFGFPLLQISSVSPPVKCAAFLPQCVSCVFILNFFEWSSCSDFGGEFGTGDSLVEGPSYSPPNLTSWSFLPLLATGPTRATRSRIISIQQIFFGTGQGTRNKTVDYDQDGAGESFASQPRCQGWSINLWNVILGVWRSFRWFQVALQGLHVYTEISV